MTLLLSTTQYKRQSLRAEWSWRPGRPCARSWIRPGRCRPACLSPEQAAGYYRRACSPGS